MNEIGKKGQKRKGRERERAREPKAAREAAAPGSAGVTRGGLWRAGAPGPPLKGAHSARALTHTHSLLVDSAAPPHPHSFLIQEWIRVPHPPSTHALTAILCSGLSRLRSIHVPRDAIPVALTLTVLALSPSLAIFLLSLSLFLFSHSLLMPSVLLLLFSLSLFSHF